MVCALTNVYLDMLCQAGLIKSKSMIKAKMYYSLNQYGIRELKVESAEKISKFS